MTELWWFIGGALFGAVIGFILCAITCAAGRETPAKGGEDR